MQDDGGLHSPTAETPSGDEQRRTSNCAEAGDNACASDSQEVPFPMAAKEISP